MEVRVLRYFLAVAREENITKAAEALHITQPTLSRQLAQMESELRVPLFERGGKRIRLTKEGILLRRRAEEIVSLVDKTEKELIEEEGDIDGTITIGCGETASMEILAEQIACFSEKYPKVRFDLFTGNADLVKEQMEKGLIDIGLLLEPIDIAKYEYVRMAVKERWGVLMLPNDPLALKDSVTAKELAQAPLILPRRTQVQNELDNWFGEYSPSLKYGITCNLSTNAAIMVQKKMGYAVIIEGSLPFLDHRQITFRPLYPELLATSVLAWKKGQPFSLAVTKFTEFIKMPFEHTQSASKETF